MAIEKFNEPCFGKTKNKRELRQRLVIVRACLTMCHERMRFIRADEHPAWAQIPMHPGVERLTTVIRRLAEGSPEMSWKQVEKAAELIKQEEQEAVRERDRLWCEEWYRKRRQQFERDRRK